MACPFLSGKMDMESTLKQPIDVVINEIFRMEGLEGIDAAPYVRLFQDNLILTAQQLIRLPEASISRLNLPLVLELGVSKFIRMHTGGSEPSHPSVPSRNTSQASLPITPASRYSPPPMSSHPSSSSLLDASSTSNSPDIPEQIGLGAPIREPVEKSALLGLSNAMRTLIKSCWAKLTDPKTTDLMKFFDHFYVNFLEADPVGRRLFKGASLTVQAQALMRMMKFIMASIDEPVKLIVPLQQLGARHLIYGVTQKSFTTWGVCLTKTLDQTLGSDIMTPETKEAWFTLTQRLAEVMLNEYDNIRSGWSGRLWKKGKVWKLRYTVLTHTKLFFFRDAEHTKPIGELDLSVLEDMDIIDEDDHRYSGMPSEWAFALKSHTDASYFCSYNEDEMEVWVEELTQRIRAHQRVKLTEDSEESPEDQKTTTKHKKSKAKSEVKKLKKGMASRKTRAPKNNQY